jgi:hypothetical protein
LHLVRATGGGAHAVLCADTAFAIQSGRAGRARRTAWASSAAVRGRLVTVLHGVSTGLCRAAQGRRRTEEPFGAVLTSRAGLASGAARGARTGAVDASLSLIGDAVGAARRLAGSFLAAQ